MAKNFIRIIKELEEELYVEGVTLNRSRIIELYREFKHAKITQASLGLAWLDFLRIKEIL